MLYIFYKYCIDSIDWLIYYLIRPMMIPVILLLVISSLLVIIYCLRKKKSLIIISVGFFVFSILYFSSVSLLFKTTPPVSVENYINTVDIKNIEILNIPNLIIETKTEGMFFSISGKQAFEYSCETVYDDTIERENDYAITQESLSFDNLFFVNRKKLEEHLTFYYIEKDIWGLDITDDDIHSFTKDNVSCTYVYKNKSNDKYYFNEFAYYAFVVYTDEKIFFNSYYVRENVPFNFNAEKTTERIVDELIGSGCLE